jgi:hypothetical protein
LLAEMANQEHLAILAKGVAAWNAWQEENIGTDPDLYEAVRATCAARTCAART